MGEANVPNKDVYKEFEKLLKPIKSVEVGACETRDSNKASPQYWYFCYLGEMEAGAGILKDQRACEATCGFV
jgi:hypothetical protein